MRNRANSARQLKQGHAAPPFLKKDVCGDLSIFLKKRSTRDISGCARIFTMEYNMLLSVHFCLMLLILSKVEYAKKKNHCSKYGWTNQAQIH